MNEFLVIGLVFASMIGWVVGGSGIRFLRWLVWPAVAGVLLGLGGIELWRVALDSVSLGMVNSLPYGEKTSPLVRGSVFLALGLPALAVNLNVWPGLFAGLLILAGLFWLSRKLNVFTFVLWEAVAALYQSGILIVACLLGT